MFSRPQEDQLPKSTIYHLSQY